MAQPLIDITRRQALAFASFLVLYEFLTYIANDMIMPGMIKVVESFHGPESAIATSLTLYILGGASLQLFLGPLSDRFGRRPVMLTGALLFFLFTDLIACSNSIQQFLAARFFQGTGLCFITVIGYATLQEIFEETDAIKLTAIMTSTAMLAPLIGPLVGAIFVSYFNWRIIFVIIGALALLALWGLWQYMPESVGQIKRNGEQIIRSSLSPRVVLSNYKNLFLSPPFMLGSIALGLSGVPCLTWIALAPIILVSSAKLSLLQYGLWQLPMFGASILGNWLLQRITHKQNVKKIIFQGSSILILSLLVTWLLPFSIDNYFFWLVPGLVIYFFGLGLVAAPLNRYVLFSTPVAKGTTSALISIIIMCLQALGIEIASILYAAHNNVHLGLYCALVGLVYLIALCGTFFYANSKLACTTIP